MTAVGSSSEHMDGCDLGIKIQLDGPADVHELKAAGERVASKNHERAKRVWVWVYGHDMDLEGPAVCVSYTGKDEPEPVTDFTDPGALALWYTMKAMEA